MTERLQRYTVARFAIAIGVLAAYAVTAIFGASGSSLGPVFTMSAVQLALLVLSTLYVRARGDLSTPLLYVLLALDVVSASLLLAFTGGAGSLLVFLFFPVIAGGAYLQGRQGALVVAGFASVALVAVQLVSGTPLDDPLFVYWEVGFRVLAFVLVGLLVGQLAESLERTGQELRAQRLTSETVIERVRAGVLTTDDQERVVEINPSGRLLLGDVRGRRVAELFSGPVQHRAWEETRPDGAHWVCSQAGLPNGGKVVVVEDVSELWAMRERVQRDERLIAVGRLSAGLAHEIRNPLAALSGLLQLLREDRPGREVELALSEAERLARLVDDFLAASRAPDLRRVRFDVAALVLLVAEAFRADGRFAGSVTLEVDASPSLAWVDPDRIRQVIWNLVINAAQAMPEGGKIRLRVAPEGWEVCVKVGDTGRGIPPEELPRIFDPFYTRRAGGTGLGLALVDQVIRAHAGTVQVESTEGEGTTFTISLPSKEPV